jgi:hypothetical protein
VQFSTLIPIETTRSQFHLCARRPVLHGPSLHLPRASAAVTHRGSHIAGHAKCHHTTPHVGFFIRLLHPSCSIPFLPPWTLHSSIMYLGNARTPVTGLLPFNQFNFFPLPHAPTSSSAASACILLLHNPNNAVPARATSRSDLLSLISLALSHLHDT